MNTDLTEKDLKLAAELLRMAAHLFANRNCNDIEDEILIGWTQEEQEHLCKEYEKWNSDLHPNDWEEGDIIQDDWILMHAIANRLDKPKPLR